MERSDLPQDCAIGSVHTLFLHIDEAHLSEILNGVLSRFPSSFTWANDTRIEQGDVYIYCEARVMKRTIGVLSRLSDNFQGPFPATVKYLLYKFPRYDQ